MSATFYRVGGSVRDEFLGIKSKDRDYAVECDGLDAMKAAILARGGEIFVETPQYFTIRARVPALGDCDFVLCRKEGDYEDGRHPETVEPGTIYDDLERRDFTVNAIAIREDGELLDPHYGRRDLHDRVLRCVGDTATRFTEDGLRMLRAIRFSITRNLSMDPDIEKHLDWRAFFEPRLQGVSIERIWAELKLCFAHSTVETLNTFDRFAYLRNYLFSLDRDRLWLKPTLEER